MLKDCRMMRTTLLKKSVVIPWCEADHTEAVGCHRLRNNWFRRGLYRFSSLGWSWIVLTFKNMNMKHIGLTLIVIGLCSYTASKAQIDKGMMTTNSHWHIINTNSLTTDLEKQIVKQFGRTNIPFVFQTLSNGQLAWTTNMEELWHGIWVEGTNGMRTQLNIVTNATNCIIRVQVGSFTLKKTPSQYFAAPNGKFVKFILTDSSKHIVQPKPTAGTNLLGNIGAFYRTNPPSWALPSAGSLVAEFPKKVSTNVWPLYYRGVGLAPIVHLTGFGNPTQINSLNLYDLYSITNKGDYTLTVQPVLYKRRAANSKFLDRVDLPSVTTNVHLMPDVK